MNSNKIIKNVFCVSKRIAKPSGLRTINGKIVKLYICYNNTFKVFGKQKIFIMKLSPKPIITGIIPSESNAHRNRFYSDGNKETPITITFVLPTNVKTVDEIERSSTITDR